MQVVSGLFTNVVRKHDAQEKRGAGPDVRRSQELQVLAEEEKGDHRFNCFLSVAELVCTVDVATVIPPIRAVYPSSLCCDRKKAQSTVACYSTKFGAQNHIHCAPVTQNGK